MDENTTPEVTDPVMEKAIEIVRYLYLRADTNINLHRVNQHDIKPIQVHRYGNETASQNTDCNL